MILRLTLLFVLLFTSVAAAAEKSTQPINIASDSMEAETKTNKVIFKGNVVAKQQDVTITSNELMATYGDNGKELKDVLATGNVRITQQNKIAAAERALFLNAERKIILTGNPKVWQGKDIITGEKIIYFLDEDRTIVEGGQERVRATIHPKKEEAFANSTGKGTD
ncbi:MAG: lipopolysaccharide transport periplasmic protein LptA [Deltaproteobacteria bacterium]|nr:lipopolysaccharide transport periplasmic protein LptA [Deltaproteobacteria bacterium]